MSQLKVNSIIPVAGVPSGGGGGIIQIKQTVKTDTFSESLSANTNSSTNCIEVSITPTSTSNHVLIIGQLYGASSYWTGTSAGAWQGRLNRGGTDIAIGDARGSRIRQTFRSGASNNTNTGNNCFIYFLDTGISTTSATTYGVRLDNLDNGTKTLYLNRDVSDQNSSTNGSSLISTLTAMEVSA
tara:strand:- start:37 stop:588 length:552 start_codon:yes stop_codon:yes gene_type:complete